MSSFMDDVIKSSAPAVTGSSVEVLDAEESMACLLDVNEWHCHITSSRCPVRFTMSRALRSVSGGLQSITNPGRFADKGTSNWSSTLDAHYEFSPKERGSCQVIAIDDCTVMLINPRTLAATTLNYGGTSYADEYADTYIKIGFKKATLERLRSSISSSIGKRVDFKVNAYNEADQYVWLVCNFVQGQIPLLHGFIPTENAREKGLPIPEDHTSTLYDAGSLGTPRDMVMGPNAGYWKATVAFKPVITLEVPKGKVPTDLESPVFGINLKVLAMFVTRPDEEHKIPVKVTSSRVEGSLSRAAIRRKKDQLRGAGGEASPGDAVRARKAREEQAYLDKQRMLSAPGSPAKGGRGGVDDLMRDAGVDPDE